MAILFFLAFAIVAVAIYLFMAVLFASFVLYAADQSQPPVTVVARVNGTPITEMELSQALTSAGPSAHARSPKLAAEVRARALDELIVRELIYQEARRKGLSIPPAEIDRGFERARKRFASTTTFKQSLVGGSNGKVLRREIERRLLIERATAREVAARTAASEAELQSFYRANRERFRKPEEVRLRAILATLAPSAKPEERNAARQKIEQVARELKAGGDFALLAEKYSGDAYREKGGLIGWVHRGRLDPEVEKVAYALPVGQFSEPFESKYGFLILKVEGKRPARQLTYAEVKESLRAELKQRKAEEAREAWISALKKKASIEILPAKPS